MQRLIDGNAFLTYLVYSKLVDEVTCGELKQAIEKCTVLTIPDNPTNGNVFDSLIDVDNDCVEVHGENGTMTFVVTQEWWNAPYKRGTKDE